MPDSGIFDSEASAVDLPVYERLKDLDWKLNDTMLYRHRYTLTEQQQADFPGGKTIEPDFVLQDLQGVPLAVVENKLENPNRALAKLRLKYASILRPRFLYACAKDAKTGELRVLFYDMAWRGMDAGEFKPADNFLRLEEMKRKIEHERQLRRNEKITIDTTIAGGFDPAAGKNRYYQLECINALAEAIRNGKMKMLVHMATGLGKTRTVVALVKALFRHGWAKRVLFVVDRRFLARQALQKGFSLISPDYNAAWITTPNFRSHVNKDIHVVVIDTLESIYDRIPSGYYDLLIVDECHRSMTIDRKLIFDHFLCPRIGLTATPRIAVPKEGVDVPDQDLAIMDTYRLFGCESGRPDYEFDLDRGISESFLAPYSKEEIITGLTREAMNEGILFDHVLDPDTRERIQLTEEQRIKLERLNKKLLSEGQAKRWAEEIRKNTEYGEKVILFAASQPHSLMLVKALNDAFNDHTTDGPRYAEAVISDNDDINYSLKDWFEKPYQNPRVVVSVDIMSTGVDVLCVRYIAFAALTKSVGKYIQMIGRGTRLDPKTGKFSFKLLDFVGQCARMKDNGRGSPKKNVKLVTGAAKHSKQKEREGLARVEGILDNPDPAHLVQRVYVHDGSLKVIDNIPVEEARRLFEEGVRATNEPLITELRSRAAQDPDYQPSEDELTAIRAWVADPKLYLSESQLQRIYDFPAGSVWDFFLAVLGLKTIPSKKERVEKGFETYLSLYNFTPEQVSILQRIKDVLVANITSHAELDLDSIFATPIYVRLIGRFDEVNQKFDGRLKAIIEEMRGFFRKAA